MRTNLLLGLSSAALVEGSDLGVCHGEWHEVPVAFMLLGCPRGFLSNLGQTWIAYVGCCRCQDWEEGR